MSGRLNKWLFVVVVCFLPGPALYAPTFLPGPPTVVFRVAYYDTSGRNGLIYDGNIYPSNPPLDARYEFYTNGDYAVPFRERPYWQVSISSALMTPGDPYYVRLYHELIGCLSSGGYVGEQLQFESNPVIPWVMIPTNLEGTAYEWEGGPVPVTSEIDYSGFGGRLYVADSRTSAGLYVSIGSYLRYPESGTGSVLVEYLEGSSLFGSPPDLVNLDPYPRNGSFSLYWGPMPPNSATSIHVRGEHPDGPIRVTASREGFTSDTVTVNLPANWYYGWDGIMTPIEGDSIVARFPPPDLMAIGVSGTLLNDCPPIAGLAPAFDPNGDGINDAADMAVLFP